MSALQVRPQVFSILSALLEERTGIHYELRDRDLVADKICARAVEAGFESLLDYYYYLRYDDPSGAELGALIDALVVNETYFFRELDGLVQLVAEFVAPRVAAHGKARVWCAASSTGEEPITLAMLLAERGILGDVEIVASDISRRALARAATGEFGTRPLRDIAPSPRRASRTSTSSEDLEARWIVKNDGKIRVREEIRERVRWCRVNLVDAVDVAALGTFDAIVCRNVLIYFRDETAQRVVAHLTDALVPGGVLLVGVSESLLRFGTSLTCEERGRVFFYRREA